MCWRCYFHYYELVILLSGLSINDVIVVVVVTRALFSALINLLYLEHIHLNILFVFQFGISLHSELPCIVST